MTFAFITYTHVTHRINGGDMYDQLLAEYLNQQGHEAVIYSGYCKAAFRYNDVLVAPLNTYRDADVVFVRPQHYHRIKTTGVKVTVQHNESKDFTLPDNVPVIYVAKHLVGMYNTDRFAVVHGINRYHRAVKITGGTKTACINLNRNKAGKHFEQLCREHPDKQFVGIKGYGEQHTPGLPNCEYREGNIDLYKVLHDCNQVVSFSQSEGYPMLVNEVQSLGIPFIGTMIKGHIEAGCSGYIGGSAVFPAKDVQPFDGNYFLGYINSLF